MPLNYDPDNIFDYLTQEILSHDDRTIEGVFHFLNISLKDRAKKSEDRDKNIFNFVNLLKELGILEDAKTKFFKGEKLKPSKEIAENFKENIKDEKWKSLKWKLFKSVNLEKIYSIIGEILQKIYDEKLKRTKNSLVEVEKNKATIKNYQETIEEAEKKKVEEPYQKPVVSEVANLAKKELVKGFEDSDKEIPLGKEEGKAKISTRKNAIFGDKAHGLEDKATVTQFKIDPSWQNYIPELLALTNTLVVTKVNQNKKIDSKKQGTTAVYLLVTENKEKQKQVYTLGVGDSFAAMVTQNGKLDGIQLLAAPHDPEDPVEKKRIRAEGGMVFGRRVGGSLATSRSIGDQEAFGVDYIGDISSYDVPKDEKNTVFMVASDGIDPLSLQMIADISQQEKNNIAVGCCNKVLEIDGRRDDVTVVTVPGTEKDFLVVLNDGHGGEAVAEYVNNEAPKIFQKIAATPRNKVTVDFLKREILNKEVKIDLDIKEEKKEEEKKIESKNVSAKTEDSTETIISFLTTIDFETETMKRFREKVESKKFTEQKNIVDHFKDASKKFSPFRARSTQRFYKSIADAKNLEATVLAYNVLSNINKEILETSTWGVAEDQLVSIPLAKTHERAPETKKVSREAAEIVKLYEKALARQITWQRALDEVETILSRSYVSMQDENAPILAIQNPDNLNDIREKFKKIEEEGKQQKGSEYPFIQKGRLVISIPKETLDLYHKWFLDIQKDYHDKLLPNIDNSVLFDVIIIDENKINRTLIELEKKILGKVNDILLLKRTEIDDKNTVRRTLDALAYDLFQWSQKIPFGTRNSSPVYNAIMKKIESFYTKSDVLSNEDSNTIRKRAETRMRDNKEIYKARSQLNYHLSKKSEQPYPQSQFKI